MINIETPLKSVPRISPKYAKILEKIGLFTVCDLLFYLPFRYDDFRKTAAVSEEFVGQIITAEGIIKKTKLNRIWKRKMSIVEIVLEDSAGTPLKAVWFNQPFILENLIQGMTVRLSGKLELKGKTFSMTGPAWEKSSREQTNTGRLVPVYPETRGLTSKWLRWQIKMILPLAKNIPEIIPADIREKYNLYDIHTAITQLHFPNSREKVLRAQKRMAFQEMFLMQIQTQKIRLEWKEKKSAQIIFDEKLIRNFVKNLPFKLTDAQRKSTFEILKDLEKSRPMNRLLNGDVGSGKTVVAAIAALQTVSAGHQVAIMAPTEVLARQHFESFCKIFKDYDFNIALLTGSYKLFFKKGTECLSKHSAPNARKKLLDEIKNNKINLVIGTHALIQKDVAFKNLALIVIDEQHRFGVAQRAALQNETMNIKDGEIKTIPHLLTMTATPIPRTLAIAFFGSLDLSLLDEMPKNRKKIITKIIPPDGREKIYEFLKSEIRKGRQIFIILPLVEQSKSESMQDVKAAAEEHKRLSEKIFSEFKLGLLHGRLKSKEKEAVMKDFQNKKIDILVSTSVVEVGVDIPNASIMLIENAERFGLTQLHQFRGRVGRGEHQSYCFLFTNGRDAINRVSANDVHTFVPTQEGTRVPSQIPSRLKILEKTGNGFEIAEHDLKLRGPGQFFGTIQSGLPDIAMENMSNIKLIKFAREEARNILQTDPQLKKHPALQSALQKFSENVHLE